MHFSPIAILLGFITSCAAKSAINGDGRCTIRGQCGKESFFGAELPCPYNGTADEPDKSLRADIVSICGDKFANGAVCCDADQISSLRENLKRAENLLASCPACLTNFFNFFCTFTCSPNQAQFLEVEETAQSRSGKTVVTHLSHYVTDSSATAFYDSCKNVKFSATNGYVMDLIGGGAKNHKEFLRFLGQKSIVGSPIQIDYPDVVPKYIQPANESTRNCDDIDERYRCACVDCPGSCPTLTDVGNPAETCHIGFLPCLSFYVLILYVVSLVILITTYLLGAARTYRITQTSRLPLGSRDGTGSDDEDQGLLAPDHSIEKSFVLDNFLQSLFYRLGYSCAEYPYGTVGICFLLVGLLSLGWIRFSIETDPVRLWVSPDSVTAQEKDFFDTTFGPFYRTQQLFLVNATSPQTSVVSYENLKWWFELEDQISSLTVEGIALEDVCLQPTGDACVIQSVTGYWRGASHPLTEESYAHYLESCAAQPVTCLPPFQQPLKPNTILGGYEDGVLQSKALVSSIVLENSLNTSRIARAAVWENELKLTLLEAQKTARTRGLALSFSTEVSLEQELNKSTNTDAKIVAISYLVMFLYASLALGGNVFRGRRSLVESKFSLGFFGILIVLLSILASVGLFSLFRIKVTLIIAEVIPFLVLAVGVDNIFLICHEFGRINVRYAEKTIEERVATTMSHIGPSILLTALSETVAFALGSAVGMPAVKNFAIYAAGSVFFDAVLQLTMFPAALAIDQRRIESNRMDCVPFIRINNISTDHIEDEGYAARFIRRRLAPYLLRPYVKAAVLLIFATLSAIALALFPSVQLGLDQKIALPQDSYLIPYFRDLEQYLGTGPPVYFVIRGANTTERSVQQAMCGRFTTCQEFSLANILEQERKRPESSYLLEPAASWIDDFLYWINPSLEMCCRVKISDEQTFCSVDDAERTCRPCLASESQTWNVSMHGLPEGVDFLRYAHVWLDAPSTEDCPIAGKAPYSDAVILDDDSISLVASNTRSFHVPLRTQSDFINSFAAARRISEEISSHTGLDIFPYAVHYIFFDQYATIVRLTFGLVGSALLAVLIISTILLGSFVAACLVSLTVTLMIVDIVGIMALWGISLNALSLVNLVICVGIGVEFCSHFARSYMLPTSQFVGRLSSIGRDREQRVWHALVSVGSSVFTGITLCKFVGVVVLAFTRSKIFEIYYFRMWLALVFVAASHGLIFLPVLFSIIGPAGYSMVTDEGMIDADWAESAGSRYTGDLLAHTEPEEDDGDLL